MDQINFHKTNYIIKLAMFVLQRVVPYLWHLFYMGCGLGAGVILTQLGIKRILTGKLDLKSEMWWWVLLTGRGKVPKNGNYHIDQCKWGPQPKCLLKFKYYIQEIYRTVWRMCILILGCKGFLKRHSVAAMSSYPF